MHDTLKSFFFSKDTLYFLFINIMLGISHNIPVILFDFLDKMLLSLSLLSKNNTVSIKSHSQYLNEKQLNNLQSILTF